MNVYMNTSAYDGCCYARLLLPAYHNGFWVSKTSPEADRDNMEETKQKMMAADIVVFHRPEEKNYLQMADVLINDGKKVVFDNDDTFKILDDVHPLANFTPDAYKVALEKRNYAIDGFLKKAHLVTTSTEFLAKEYRKLNKNVVVLPNCVDPMDWEEPLKNETDKVRIGMVGSVSYEYDYLHLKDVLRELSKRKDVQLILFGLGDAKHRLENPKVTKAFKDEYDFWDSIDKEQIPWCPFHQYIDKLREARLDMMLIPRKDNYFNRCKSNIKFLEAAMAEIPVIAQSFKDGPYEELEGKEMGILVKDNKDWMDDINNLINDKQLRRTLGKNAKEYTLKYYNIEDNAHLWAEAYEKIRD